MYLVLPAKDKHTFTSGQWSIAKKVMVLFDYGIIYSKISNLSEFWVGVELSQSLWQKLLFSHESYLSGINFVPGKHDFHKVSHPWDMHPQFSGQFSADVTHRCFDLTIRIKQDRTNKTFSIFVINILYIIIIFKKRSQVYN
jgi:hypothetical protein